MPTAALPTVMHGSFVTLHYRLAGTVGTLITTFAGKPATLSVGAGELSPAVEARLIGLAEGTHTTFELPEGEAFGPHNRAMCQWVARRLLDDLADPEKERVQYAVGDVVQFPTPDGVGSYAGTVLQVRDDGAVYFDFNHPLAGQAVTLEVQIIGVL